jgi:hypothetical protein
MDLTNEIRDYMAIRKSTGGVLKEGFTVWAKICLETGSSVDIVIASGVNENESPKMNKEACFSGGQSLPPSNLRELVKGKRKASSREHKVYSSVGVAIFFPDIWMIQGRRWLLIMTWSTFSRSSTVVFCSV